MQREIHRLRAALRDVVALSTLPAAWVGKEPKTIVAGLADVLVEAFELDFVFVRLRDHTGGDSIDVRRGESSPTFSEWLQDRLATPACEPDMEISSGFRDAGHRYRGLVIPIGFNAGGGLIAAASDRPNFPTETEQLLLSVATNHAAMAFRSAQLVHDLRQTDEQLRVARDELEMKVRARTKALRRAGAEMQTILDASPLGMVLLRQDHTVQRCNPAFERLVGWPSEEILGRRILLTETM